MGWPSPWWMIIVHVAGCRGQFGVVMGGCLFVAISEGGLECQSRGAVSREGGRECQSRGAVSREGGLECQSLGG